METVDLKSPGSNHVGSSPTRPTLTIRDNSPREISDKPGKACVCAGFFFLTLSSRAIYVQLEIVGTPFSQLIYTHHL